MAGSLARDSDNLVQFQPKENIKLQRLHQISEELEQQSHLFVVILGTVIVKSL
uniref:hypothetical protein n=1 Tax=Acinetobacter lwoffii TaxID=28090 RepID=UPI0021CDB9A6